MCTNQSLQGIFSIVKRIVQLIQIIVPILLIIFASISFMKLVKNPEEKKGTKKIMNQFLAAVIIFFIPLLVDVTMNLVGDKSEISSCWNSASDKMSINQDYQLIGEEKKKSIIKKASDYEKGTSSGNLDFSCTSNIVKSQFSCETLKIVEKHLNDFNAQNFNEKIASYGGFENYAKSLGGIFAEYYGKKMPNETVADFQRASEYVLGWMYMYGWDYSIGWPTEGHTPWGENGYSKDAFYVNGGYVGTYIPDHNFYSPAHWIYGTDFDHIISGKNGGVGRMASACGDFGLFVYNKMGLEMHDEKRLDNNIRRLKDLQVGDKVAFFGKDNAVTDDTANHLAQVGEVYDDRVVIYDGASNFQVHKNYKHVIMIPKENSEKADKKAVQEVYGWPKSWIGYRFYEFK